MQNKLQWPPGWPRTPKSRKQSGRRFTRFGEPLPFEYAYDTLIGELRLLGASKIIVSVDRYSIDDGVAVYFRRDGTSMVMATDRFNTAGANMRSLTLAIEAMRQLERHGGSAMADRAMAGFTALPPPRSCWEVLAVKPDAGPEEIERAFRAQALKHHPDRGGSDSVMAELNAARAEALGR